MIKSWLKSSLKARLIFAFSSFALILSLLYWLLSVGSMWTSEDSIFNRQIGNEVKRQQQFYAQNQHFDQLPLDMQLHDERQIQRFPYYDKIRDRPLGIFELESENYHIAKALIQPDNKTFYITYFVKDQEIDDATFHQISFLFAVVFFVVASIGIATGVYIGSRTAAPIVRLDKKIQAMTPDDSFGDTESFGDDEIGRLAKSFAHSYERSQRFLEREKRFTREVSHELRTPTAVISGALDILDIQPDNPQAIGRIRRATSQMQQLIETFLLLGREENMRLSELELDTQTLCNNIVEQHRRECSLPIHFYFINNPKLRVLAPVFAIVLNNLLNNAVRHTSQGEISVTLERDHLCVQDSGCGFEPSILANIGKPYVQGSQGQGLGLSIVGRICQQFNWQLKVDSTIGKGSTVKIVF